MTAISVENTIIRKLLSIDPVTDIVSDKITPAKLDQLVEFPSIKVQLISDVGQVTHNESQELFRASIQIDCFSDTYGQVKALSRQVKKGLDNWKGTIEGIQVQGVTYINSFDEPYDGEVNYYRLSQEYEVWYCEAS